MEAVIRGALSLETPLPGSVVTVGTFDGVHRGHQSLTMRARAMADRRQRPLVVYTFDPHPARLFAPQAPKTLMPIDRRVEALLSAGADRVLVERFDRSFANVDAQTWVERYLVDKLHPEHIVVGFNFSFGRGKSGDPAFLRRMGTLHGFSVEVVEAVRIDGRTISSTEVRRAVAAGDVVEAAILLGRPFAVVGVVEAGDGRGRTIGFPTANVRAEHEQIPAFGVYAGWLEILNGPRSGQRFRAVTNVGQRPTFGGTTTTVEAHVLDGAVDLYDLRVAVEMKIRIREERAFDGPDALKAQIQRDVARAREELASP